MKVFPQADITIYDIARQLHLSAATVSRALKDHPAINSKTKKKVTDLATKLGYRPNNFASNLRRGNTHTIGVLVHELNSSFITAVLAGIEKVTTAANYDLLIGHSSESAKKEIANATNLFHKRVDGLIASLAFDTANLSHFDPFIKKGIPLVFFDRAVEDSDITKVVINNFKAGYEMTRHLVQQGCKRILHVTASLKRNVYADRLRGYKKALKEAGILYREELVVVNGLEESDGIATARQVIQMKKKPDAIFVTNDFCAAVIMHALQEAGIRIPEDMAIAGFNNDVIGKIISPRLTTIDYPGIQMGEVAARHLIDQLEGKTQTTTNKIIIQSELIIRESSIRKR